MNQPIESRAWCRHYRQAYNAYRAEGYPKRVARIFARDYANLIFYGTIYPRKEAT